MKGRYVDGPGAPHSLLKGEVRGQGRRQNLKCVDRGTRPPVGQDTSHVKINVRKPASQEMNVSTGGRVQKSGGRRLTGVEASECVDRGTGYRKLELNVTFPTNIN